MTIYESPEEMIEDAENSTGHPFHVIYRGKSYYLFARSTEAAAHEVASDMGMAIAQVPFNELFALIKGGKKAKKAIKPAVCVHDDKPDDPKESQQKSGDKIPDLGGFTLKGLREFAKSKKITIPADVKEIQAIADHILAEAGKRGITITGQQTPFDVAL